LIIKPKSKNYQNEETQLATWVLLKAGKRINHKQQMLFHLQFRFTARRRAEISINFCAFLNNSAVAEETRNTAAQSHEP